MPGPPGPVVPCSPPGPACCPPPLGSPSCPDPQRLAAAPPAWPPGHTRDTACPHAHTVPGAPAQPGGAHWEPTVGCAGPSGHSRDPGVPRLHPWPGRIGHLTGLGLRPLFLLLSPPGPSGAVGMTLLRTAVSGSQVPSSLERECLHSLGQCHPLPAGLHSVQPIFHSALEECLVLLPFLESNLMLGKWRCTK